MQHFEQKNIPALLFEAFDACRLHFKLKMILALNHGSANQVQVTITSLWK